MGCGGMCLIGDFGGEMMPGVPFKGHGLTAYDTSKKKYVGSWSDSMSSGMQVSEGSYDAATKSTTSWIEGAGRNNRRDRQDKGRQRVHRRRSPDDDDLHRPDRTAKRSRP